MPPNPWVQALSRDRGHRLEQMADLNPPHRPRAAFGSVSSAPSQASHLLHLKCNRKGSEVNKSERERSTI